MSKFFTPFFCFFLFFCFAVSHSFLYCHCVQLKAKRCCVQHLFIELLTGHFLLQLTLLFVVILQWVASLTTGPTNGDESHSAGKQSEFFICRRWTWYHVDYAGKLWFFFFFFFFLMALFLLQLIHRLLFDDRYRRES